ncbi:MAG: hypothetical protein F6J97_03420 [Leptolyngbya sp. SIO4C1]|nr:hypothetical protein [Leptolyngbya sp. SIO4C1]
MSDAVLSQLVEAESQLASQETHLVAQIAAIKEKRKGLQTVIDMFQSSGNSNGAVAPAEAVEQVLTGTAEAADTETAKAAEDTADAPSTARKAKTPSKAKKTTRKGRAKSTAASTPARKQRGGKSPNWQRYIQEPFRKTPLPDVVANILNAQPDDVFKIADVMEAIFKEDMPKATFLKARNRVSNILSAGARNGDWYRGRGGTYAMSEKAVKK